MESVDSPCVLTWLSIRRNLDLELNNSFRSIDLLWLTGYESITVPCRFNEFVFLVACYSIAHCIADSSLSTLDREVSIINTNYELTDLTAALILAHYINVESITRLTFYINRSDNESLVNAYRLIIWSFLSCRNFAVTYYSDLTSIKSSIELNAVIAVLYYMESVEAPCVNTRLCISRNCNLELAYSLFFIDLLWLTGNESIAVPSIIDKLIFLVAFYSVAESIFHSSCSTLDRKVFIINTNYELTSLTTALVLKHDVDINALTRLNCNVSRCNDESLVYIKGWINWLLLSSSSCSCISSWLSCFSRLLSCCFSWLGCRCCFTVA